MTNVNKKSNAEKAHQIQYSVAVLNIYKYTSSTAKFQIRPTYGIAFKSRLTLPEQTNGMGFELSKAVEYEELPKFIFKTVVSARKKKLKCKVTFSFKV